jgi:hypothetical protein
MRPAGLLLFAALLLPGGAIGGSSLYAQSLPTATKTAEINAFGGYTASSPDFNNFAKEGLLLGGNFTIYPFRYFDPSLEIRFTYARSSSISEHSFLVGPRIQKDYGKLHPYADFLFGDGRIAYHPVLVPKDPSDGGLALSFGGGLEYDIVHHISLKVDVQEQSFNLGQNFVFKPDGSAYTLTPRTYSVGATYHFPFRGLNKQKELR